VVNYASSEGEAHELVASIKAAGGRAWAIRADVADASAVKELFDRAERECGQVDVLVNNAGILKLPTIAAFRDEDYASITVKKSDWCGSNQAANACASANCDRIARN
jgi:3-oxoacyl-[acyl-carrier protein] reductase